MATGANDDQQWRELLARQVGVVSRSQALTAGWTTDQVQRRVRNGRWARQHPGVYVTFTGPVSWESLLWAALLHAGDGAVASHRSAGRLQRLVDDDPTTIEVAVPWGRTVLRQPGVIVRSTRHLESRRHPARSLPQTRVEDTVLDLVEGSDRLDDVVAWLTRASQRRLTTADRLDAALGRRSRLRHRRLVSEVLGETADGVASTLERRYLHDVERRHALPRSTRGERIVVAARTWYADVRYGTFRLRVELEGLRWHAGNRSRDAARDNAAVLHGDTVLRYDWAAVVGHPCATAQQVAQVLRRLGWQGSPQACSSTCPVIGPQTWTAGARPRTGAG